MPQDKKTLDTKEESVVQKSERQAIIDRLYGHRSTLNGLLKETEKMIDWMIKKN